MSAQNLQDVLDNAGNTVELLRNSQLGAVFGRGARELPARVAHRGVVRCRACSRL
jgi:hypothetical protein